MPDTYDVAIARAAHKDVDTRFSEYHELMSIKVQEVLLVAQNYEQALDVYNRFKPYVFGVISDTRFPLAQLIADLMKVGREGLGCDVEFEFCLNLKPETDGPDEFYILQVRPLTAGQEHADIHVDKTDISSAVCYSTQCLGN